MNGNPTSGSSYGTNPDNPPMAAGSTFVGQFTDHDIMAWAPGRAWHG